MLPSALKYLYSVEPVRMHFPAKQPCANHAALHTVSFVNEWVLITEILGPNCNTFTIFMHKCLVYPSTKLSDFITQSKNINSVSI